MSWRRRKPSAEAMAARNATTRAAAQAAEEHAARRAAEAARDTAAAAAETARAELAELTAGGPLRRAIRAFAFRRVGREARADRPGPCPAACRRSLQHLVSVGRARSVLLLLALVAGILAGLHYQGTV